MKLANEVLDSIKGAGKAKTTLTGKGAFSQAGYAAVTKALANDTTFTVPVREKDGKTTQVNISQLVRDDAKKTNLNAGSPQKSENKVFETSPIETNGWARAMLLILREYLKAGRKVEIPADDKFNGALYLAPVAGKTKTVQVRDIKTKEELGTTTIVSQDSIQIRAQSRVPKHLQTKTRRDKDGKVVK